MISLVLYGRNDSHGYNLHRRAALSLNCLAEVLTDDDDEIVFVDYNTPDELPTFVEALADTLTDHCLSRLRVFRVPAALHHERFASVTRLPMVEPVCRNAAVRRANPANRWLLSTNTDMILVPNEGESLSDICRDLPDGFYGLPKFELPEWLWEQLPRDDPPAAMSEVRRLGPRLRLDEPTLNNEWVLFDAPGDFQLVLREDFVAIDGFDEAMLLGWHVDSNLSRRIFLRRGSIEAGDDRISGYHCNHNRTPTVLHATARTENDLDRFFFAVERPDLPDQRETWGLSELNLEEIAVGRHGKFPLTAALLSAVPASDVPRVPSDVRKGGASLTYDSGHVLPHVVDSLAVSSPRTTILYLGANDVLRDMISFVVNELEGDFTLRNISDAWGVADAETADVLVVDFGLDAASTPDGDPQGKDGVRGGPLVPDTLRSVVIAFDRLVREERSRLQTGGHPRRFVLVNSEAAYVNAFVVSNLDCSHTSVHSRVRRAKVKAVPTSSVRAERDLTWSDRLERPRVPLALRAGETAEIGELDHLDAFGPGWWFPDPSAIWTRGARGVITLACPDAGSRPAVIELTFDRVGVRRGDTLDIRIAIEGTRVGRRVLPGGPGLVTWRARIPSRALSQASFDVVFELDSHGAWTDDRQLGLHLRSVAIKSGAIPIPVLESVEQAKRLVARSRRLRRAHPPARNPQSR